MFGFFKNNKPEIQKQINQAILEEKRRLESIKEDISSKLSNNEEVDKILYSVNLMLLNPSSTVYKKENMIVKNASSREMFQTLNKISPDAEYNVENDTATGTVKGYRIFMMRHQGFRYHYISISATIKNINSYIEDCFDEYKSSVEMTEVPEFIKKAIGS
jgi:alpha-acetolactate decarboxylase